MGQIQRTEILDYMTYSERRDTLRPVVLKEKAARRVHLGSYLTFLFENQATIRYQIQEMVLHERLVREADIEHEIETYGELLGGAGELGCTLLIEIDDPAGRDEKLRRWMGLNESLYLRLEDGGEAPAQWDPRQVGDDRLSSVQYLRFDTGGVAPVGIGCRFDDPELALESALDERQRAALSADLQES